MGEMRNFIGPLFFWILIPLSAGLAGTCLLGIEFWVATGIALAALIANGLVVHFEKDF